MKTGDFDQYVDKVLKQYLDGKHVFIYAEIEQVVPELEKKNEKEIFIDFLVYAGLFTESIDSISGGTLLKITPKGYGIYLSGGWRKHLETEELKKQLEIDLVKSSIRSNRTTVRILVITVIISIVSVIISWLDYKKAEGKHHFDIKPDSTTIKKSPTVNSDSLTSRI